MSTVVLVMTDVEGSTRSWADHPHQMNLAMARHHEIVQGAITRRGGWRPTDQGEGDAVFAAFESAQAAVAAVDEFQRALAAEAWPDGITLRVRVGVHAGEVIARDGNLFGSTVNRCARIRSLGAGGQALLSAPVFELVRDALPDGVGLLDLGLHRMKDLTRPEQVYQLLIPGLRSEFPPLASLDRARHNLPVQTSSFIGRDREVAHLVALVGSDRLVTVVGFGGMGKTRLALQVAAEFAVGDGDGVWLIDLSNETDATRVPSLIAAAVGISETGDGPLPALLAGLRDKRLLLVLDNCEQLLPDLAGLVDQLLRAAPDIRVLATSREALRLRGEHLYPLQPLPVPPPLRAGSGWTKDELNSLSTYAAVTLFLTRAAAVRPDFVLTVTNAAAVAGICARLEGLPLALELAAARTRALSPEALLPRLENALAVLVGGSRDLPTRQQTLRATIAWSYDTLTDDHQQLLNRLSIFPGSFTLDAAEHICGPALSNDQDDLDVLDGVQSLVDRSLLQFHPSTADQTEDRYNLLVSIHDYAADHLAASSRAGQLATRHVAYYTTITALQFTTALEQLRRHTVNAELHNIRVALTTVRATGSPDEEVALAGNVLEAFREQGLYQECLATGDSALARPATVTPNLLNMLWEAVASEELRGKTRRGAELAERAVTAARELGDPSLIISALCKRLATSRSRTAVTALVEEIGALLAVLPRTGTYLSPANVARRFDAELLNLVFFDPELSLQSGRRFLESASGVVRVYCQSNLLYELNLCGRFDEAESLAALFEHPDQVPDANDLILASGAHNAAQLRLALGDVATASADLDLAEARLAASPNPRIGLDASLLRAAVLRIGGDLPAAEQLLTHLLDAPSNHVDEIGLARTRWLLAVISRETGQRTRAADLLDRAWAAVAGRDVDSLDLVLECLLERAVQLVDTDPREAVRLLGLVAAHRGSYVLLDGVTYDTDGILLELRHRIGDSEVTAVLAAVASNPLPSS